MRHLPLSSAEPAAAVVIGGGFYGCMLAAHLRQAGGRVVLCEKHDDILERASHTNQARVHNGYHYPRSMLTGLRSRVNFPGSSTSSATASTRRSRSTTPSPGGTPT